MMRIVFAMFNQIHFTGPAHYRIRRAAELGQSVLEISRRRLLKGPRHPGWTWFVEVCTHALKTQVSTALTMSNVEEARRYLSSAIVTSPALAEFKTVQVVEKNFRGTWFTGGKSHTDVTLLYFHGGGYSFYPPSYENIIALLAFAAKAQTFALDYRLTPENPFPAQLQDALHAYRWLLDSGIEPSSLVVAGDSAGGNLTLASLLALRDLKLPQPALAIALSPATDFEAEILDNDLDWIDRRALLKWANWFCSSGERTDPLVSPCRANLRGLCPIYIQAGGEEILYASIRAFADHAQSQGADLTLETWKDMPHIFQVFGPDAPQSAEALERIGQIVDFRVRAKPRQVACAELGC